MKPDETSWIVLIFVLVCLAVGVIVNAPRAFGHAGDDSLSRWYRSLQTPAGESCCSEQDCFPVDAKVEGAHWLAKIDGEWRGVPDEIILKRENIEGRAVACVFQGELRCFVPPAAA